MLIKINSRRVDSYKLKIYVGSQLVYENYMFSSTKNEINIDISEGQSLRIEYDFNLSKTEVKSLLGREDCPDWGTDAYDSSNLLHNNSDWIGENRCPKVAKGLYATNIYNIGNDTEGIHLLFRRSAFNPDMPLLYLMDRGNRETLEVNYERVEHAEKILYESKKKIRKKLFIDLIIILILASVVFLLYKFNCSRSLIYPVLFTIALLCYRFWNLANGYKRFFSMIKQTSCFKEKKGKVVSCK